jgi:Tol biopolymer transport system component
VYGRGGFERRVVLVARSGRESALEVAPRGYRFPKASPDGRWLAVTIDPQPPEIWVIDLEQQRAQPVSTEGYHLFPVWSRDGARLAFNTSPGVAWVPWPGGGALNPVSGGGFNIDDWSRDDLMFGTPGADLDIVTLHVGTGSIRPWLVTPAVEWKPRVSRDGAWVAYSSDVSGTAEIYVRGLAGEGGGVPVSSGGGREPIWSADDTELFYRNGSSIMAVRVRTGPRFEVLGRPEELFAGDYDFSNDSNWDVLPDGRFVMIRSSPGVRREIRVRMNWIH